MSETSFDLIVIGAGPGGYVAAIRASQLGLKTALIEKESRLGGTCLRVGCIPSKALLHSTELYHFLQEKGSSHGINITGASVDVPTLMKRKDSVVERLCGGVSTIVEKRGITIVQGTGSLTGVNGQVLVKSKEGEQKLTAKNILIATGSSVIDLPFLPVDGQTVITSDHAIALEKVPAKLAVVGAGAIGLELGSVWARLGSEVTVVELLPQIAPTCDQDVSKLAQRLFKKQGIKFELGVKVTGLKKEKGKTYLTAQKGETQLAIEADKILVAVGRRPNTAGLGAQEAGLKLDERGRIVVDSHYRTNLPNVYAIGDVIPGPMLAHKAEEEGIACVELISGKAGHVNYAVIPNVIYTSPEIASVGIGEDAAKRDGLAVNVGKFNFAANGRAIAVDATDGFVKVIADAKSDRLLGVQIIGHSASELIAAAVAHMEYGGSAEDFGRTVYAHPTLSESLKEAALAVGKASIHQLA